MKIEPNTKKLGEILASFYELNGIRIVIFDSEYNEIMAYPENKCRFCSAVRMNEALNERCIRSDLDACEKSLKQDDIYIYKCHAGLVEAVMPIKYDRNIVGYMMFGQITDIKDKSELRKMADGLNQKYGLSADISGIKFRSRRQIVAAAKILEICTEYIILKEMITPENDRIIKLAKEYIKEKLSEELNIDEICAYCGCGRTKLYKMFKSECGMGIAGYISEKRLSRARRLLKSTDFTVAEIAAECGFCDYNYFSRVYKKRYGVSPRRELTRWR